MKNVLTIAGSDSGGGAGIQADLKTMCALGVFGMTAVTAVTMQNTQRVSGVQEIDPVVVAGQIDAVYADLRVDAVKIGMLSSLEIIRAVGGRLRHYGSSPVVLDPVMVSKSGCRLLREEAERELTGLFSFADVITPNLPEAELLAGMRIRDDADTAAAAERIRALGARNVLIKGGRRESDANDLLLLEGEAVWLAAPRVDTRNINGAGCTLSSAIACFLAKGLDVRRAVEAAKSYVTRALRDSLSIGGGVGPLGHLVDLYRRAGEETE